MVVWLDRLTAITKQVCRVETPAGYGTGFIGKHLVRTLTERGHAVRAVTRGLSSAQIALAGLPVELVQGDLANPAFLDRALDGIEVVYHLAKAVGDKWDDYYRQDVLVTKNIAERAQAKGVRRFIYTGTIDSFYSARASDVITGDTPLDPNIATRNHYARSKATCEALLLEMHRQGGFPVVIFRLHVATLTPPVVTLVLRAVTSLPASLHSASPWV